MGVKDLWPLLQGAFSEVNIVDLQGQTVAVDLSGWIFESMNAGHVAEKISKPYIRTLFYRVCKLIKYGIKPVFVIDGIAPSLKECVLVKRRLLKEAAKSRCSASRDTWSPTKTRDIEGLTDSQSPTKIGDSQSSTKTGDSQSPTKPGVNRVTDECCELLDCLGIPYIQASGEAESTCAMLNRTGVVDACMTNDCDVFLFGASKVYRHFSGNEKETTVKCYTMDSIERECNLDRGSLIAFALLVGCDYSDGVYGIGEGKASSFLSMLKSQSHPAVSPLDRLKGWRSDTRLDEISSFKQLKKPTHCGLCNHQGNKTAHEKQGCGKCGTLIECTTRSDKCDCDWHQKQGIYESHKLEINIRNEAIKDPAFPSEEVMCEFLSPTWKPPEKAFWWNRPDFKQSQEYLQVSMKWSKEDVEKRMLPVLTAWDLTNAQQCLSQPSRILRGRTQNKMEQYEVEWDHVEGLTKSDLVTLEQKELFSSKFPEMAKQFEDLLKKTKETPTKWKSQGRTLEQREEALKLNRKITDMFPLKKKTYIKRTDIVHNPDSPVVSARKKLVFQNIDCKKTPSSATRSSPRKSKRPLRFGDSPANQPSVKKLFASTSAMETKHLSNLQTSTVTKDMKDVHVTPTKSRNN